MGIWEDMGSCSGAGARRWAGSCMTIGAPGSVGATVISAGAAASSLLAAALRQG